jgi:hypothetical protein
MRIVLATVFLLTSFLVKAQESSLEINSNLGFMNTHFNEPLLSESYGFLDDKEKDNIISALDSDNFFQAEIDNELKYSHKKGWSIAFGNHLAAYGAYSDDIVKLTLLGNSPFRGEQLDLEPLDFTAYHYSKFEVGYQWNSKFNTSISLLAGHQFAELDVNKATFYTDEFSDFFEYDMAFEGHFSDTTDLMNNLFALNGKGAALNIHYSDSIRNGRIDIGLKDLGMIRWNEKTTNLLIDSEWHFEGVNIDDFIEFNDSILENYFDSIQDVFQKHNEESYNWRLPITLKLNIFQWSQSEFIDAYSFSVVHKPRFYTTPRFALDLHKSFKKHGFSLGYHLGGYEKAGFQFAYNFSGNKTQFKLFSKQANALIPSQNYGVHLGFGIKRVFSTSK